MLPAENTPTPIRTPVHCGACGRTVFDGLVIKSRVVRVLAAHAEAKCRCKAWVPVPLRYFPRE